jgi:thiamine kinase-like enzyme
MIPQEKSAAVTRGLREAFGVTEFEEIYELAGGLNANPVFRVVVRGSAFLLRINMRAGDLTRHYTSMKAAAEAGLAPHVWYTSVEDRLSITDLVDVKPFPIAEALTWIPNVLRTLHALPPFPAQAHHLNTTCTFLLHKGAALDGFIQKIRSANLFPQAVSEEFFARYAQVAAAYPHHHPDMVSSHNDLFKPDNILFDGRRIWLVDWEAAFLNDRYADLAVVANLIVRNDDEELVYLREYFGGPPDEYQRARFFLMCQVAHMFYAMVFLLLGSAGTPIDWNETAPQRSDLYQRIWEGEINLRHKEAKVAFGMAHCQELLQNALQERFNEALRILSDRHAAIPRPDDI